MGVENPVQFRNSDMFCGIGYWVLQLAKHQRPQKLICIDINPNAIEALKQNIKLNKLDPEKFDLRQSDCTKTENLEKVGNRILLGLIPCCCFAIKPAIAMLDRSKPGFLHIHHNFTESSKARKSADAPCLVDVNCCEERRRFGKICETKCIETELQGELFDLGMD